MTAQRAPAGLRGSVPLSSCSAWAAGLGLCVGPTSVCVLGERGSLRASSSVAPRELCFLPLEDGAPTHGEPSLGEGPRHPGVLCHPSLLPPVEITATSRKSSGPTEKDL